EYDLNSFSSEQALTPISVQGMTSKATFSYQQGRDALVYYLRIQPLYLDGLEPFIFIHSMEQFYRDLNVYFYYLLICGVIFGIIVMAGLYNAFVYYFNRERAFIYYALMQFAMVSMLAFSTGLISITESMQSYDVLSLITAFFGTLFVRAFLDTASHFPRWDKVLLVYMGLLVLDMGLVFSTAYSFVSDYRLYSLFGLVYLWVGYLRLKQEGYKPARFFLIGWGVLIVSIFLAEHFEESLTFNPILLGSLIEAILLAMALAYKMKLLAEEQEQQKELMIHQSKLASMGEMIGNIAHQWRQPLTYLSYSFMNLKEAQKQGALSPEYLNRKVDDATKQLEFMSQTIDDFRDFYAPHKAKETFSLVKATEATLELMRNSLSQADIEVIVEVKQESEIENYKNEYKQVLVNLLSNAKDALVHRAIASPQIIIEIDTHSVTVRDNAGGIEPTVLKRIFEPYFTTKQGNSGIGLYMSKMIVERNMGGKLLVENDEIGAVFRMLF
ncbi:MAG TPA: hypothetical protein ENK86_04680, partial [Campylobacterales bacterium]|nr:hypothetical protein [Campylobacterales bacterium]